MFSDPSQLLESISAAFPPGTVRCVITLRQGNEIDSSQTPGPDVPLHDWREVGDAELETHHWGLAHLDAESWRFYLPAFLQYSIRYSSRVESLVIDACLKNLRPPDRIPSRYTTLTGPQRQAVIRALEFLVLDSASGFASDASQVLEESWTDRPLSPDA